MMLMPVKADPIYWIIQLQGTLSMCGERRVLFDNKTKDPKKVADQLSNLLLHVNFVVEKNGGKPYTSDLFKDLKVRI